MNLKVKYFVILWTYHRSHKTLNVLHQHYHITCAAAAAACAVNNKSVRGNGDTELGIVMTYIMHDDKFWINNNIFYLFSHTKHMDTAAFLRSLHNILFPVKPSSIVTGAGWHCLDEGLFTPSDDTFYDSLWPVTRCSNGEVMERAINIFTTNLIFTVYVVSKRNYSVFRIYYKLHLSSTLGAKHAL